ncbi:MAG TPA: hypothetical protein VFL97_05140 [Nitrococcus sp.]|nr:hypothetical protein [Nitrococcus sp.]
MPDIPGTYEHKDNCNRGGGISDRLRRLGIRGKAVFRWHETETRAVSGSEQVFIRFDLLTGQEMKVLTKNRLITVALAVAVIALMNRNDTTKKLLTGDGGGLFG